MFVVLTIYIVQACFFLGTGDEEKSEEKEDEEHNLGEDETNPSDAENEDKRNASN